MTTISKLINDSAEAGDFELFERLVWLEGEQSNTEAKAKALGHAPSLVETVSDPEQYWACTLCGAAGVAAMSAEPDQVIYSGNTFEQRCDVGYRCWWEDGGALQEYVEEVIACPSHSFRTYVENHLNQKVFCKGGWGSARFCLTSELSTERANARFVTRELDKAKMEYEELDGDIYINTETRAVVGKCYEMFWALFDHPVLDEEILSEVEDEDRKEAWSDWGRRQMNDAIERMEIQELLDPEDPDRAEYTEEQEKELLGIFMAVTEHDGRYVQVQDPVIEHALERAWPRLG